MEELNYRTIEGSGTIRLRESTVQVALKRGFSDWKYEVPYTELRASPAYAKTTQRLVLNSLAIGAGGLCLIFLDSFISQESDMPPGLRIFITILCSSLILFAYLHRRLQWVVYYGSKSINVYFARDRRNTLQFDDFAAELSKRIENSQTNSTQNQ